MHLYMCRSLLRLSQMVQAFATEQLAIEGADRNMKASMTSNQADFDTACIASNVLPDDVLWSALRAKSELERRGEPLVAPKSMESDPTQQAEAEKHISSAGSARIEPVVTHVHVFFIVGVALITMQVDLNAAVISFTLLFHLCRLANRVGWTKFCLQDMRLDESGQTKNRKNNRKSNDAKIIGVGDWVRLKNSSASDAAVAGIVKSFDSGSGRYTVIRQALPGSSEIMTKPPQLDNSQEVTSNTTDVDNVGALASDVNDGIFTASFDELSLVEMISGSPHQNAQGGSGDDSSGLSEPLLLSADSDDVDAEDPVDSNCWIVLCSKCALWCRSIAKEEVERERRRSSINMLDGDGAGTEVRIARKGTVAGSIFNLCNCMLGVGVLALPSAFSRVGVVLGLVLLLSCAVRLCNSVFVLGAP